MTSRLSPRVALAIATGLLGLLCALAAQPARADVFGTISLLSASPFGQAEFAHDPAISEDGRYVVFDGSVGGVTGLWRRETRPGATLEQVAGGDATLPSVSADGRYISFTTNEGASLPAITDGQIQLGEPVLEAPGVYVRDMDISPGEAGAFTLASAKDGSSQSLTYEFPGAEPAEVEVKRITLGATAAGRSAITADGRTVVFVTTAQSDLAGPETPPLQVAVRHLDTEETQLVSVRFDPATGRPALNPETGQAEPVPEDEGHHGAVWSLGSPPTFETHKGAVTRAYRVPTLAGASISADGTAVAWLGEQISEQARMLSEETTTQTYAEPLWRRISGGPSEPTRRVIGGSDPESPGCLAHPEGKLPGAPSPSDPCQGPFATQTNSFGTWNDAAEADAIPRLSANGDDVAFIASVALTSEAGGFGFGGHEYPSDAYWVDMAAPDRDAALRQLTQFASGEKERISTNAGITDVAISPSGGQVAFTTKRTVFPLGVPAYTSVPAAVPGLAELYEANLENETLTRLTQGYNGAAAEHPEPETGKEDRYAKLSDGALSPSFSAGAETLAFSDTASNLVFGDGNTPIDANGEVADGADAYLAPRIIFSEQPTTQTISPAPGNPVLEPPWRLTVSAASLSNGTVQIRAVVPSAGTLIASASSVLPATAARRKQRKVKRTIAHATTTPRAGASSVVKLELKLGGRYRALANHAGGLAGTVTVTFAAKGHPTLRKTLKVRFVHRSPHRKRRSRR
jgi:hypothetical protein